MNEGFKDFCVGLLLGAAAGVALAVWVYLCSNAHWQQEAIAHGKAEYYLDSHNERQWRWKETNGH